MTEFHPGSVPVMVASKVLGMDREVLMNSMDSGELDLGFVHKTPRKENVHTENFTSLRKNYMSYLDSCGGERKQ